MTIYGYCLDDEPKYKYTVYFIRDGLGHIKIGITDDVVRRLNQLQTSNPVKLELYAGFGVKSQFDAREIERHLHEKFSGRRLHGEWFDEEKVLEFLSKDEIVLCGYAFEGGWQKK